MTIEDQVHINASHATYFTRVMTMLIAREEKLHPVLGVCFLYLTVDIHPKQGVVSLQTIGVHMCYFFFNFFFEKGMCYFLILNITCVSTTIYIYIYIKRNMIKSKGHLTPFENSLTPQASLSISSYYLFISVMLTSAVGHWLTIQLKNVFMGKEKK